MTAVGVLLILLSAALHIFWNTLVKTSKDATAFSLQLQLIGALSVLPFGLALGWPKPADLQAVFCALGSGLFYAIYYCAIAYSYRRGQISGAYPVIRGVAPAAAALFGILIYGDRPSLLAGVGIATVCLGTIALSWVESSGLKDRISASAVGMAVVAGLASSGYLLVDKVGIKHSNPLFYVFMSFGFGFLLQGALIRTLKMPLDWTPWQNRNLIAAALACVGGYALVLLVLSTAPVSYVVPLRAASVVFSIYLGRKLFGESASPVKYLIGALITAGIVAISLG